MGGKKSYMIKYTTHNITQKRLLYQFQSLQDMNTFVKRGHNFTPI